MQIEITEEQSKILNETCELIIIEPMEQQPEECKIHGCNNTGGYGEHCCNGNEKICMSQCPEHVQCEFCHTNKNSIFNIKDELKYKQGQEVEIKQHWYKTLAHELVNHQIQSPETMPEELWEKATITEVYEPKRVQDISFSIWQDVFNKDICCIDCECWNIKNWFNEKYSNPIPVECDRCDSHKIKRLAGSFGFVKHSNGKKYSDKIIIENCENCNGDGIGRYISYVYDENYSKAIKNEFYEDYYNYEYIGDFSEWRYKRKPLNIIVNPYCEIFKIKVI